MSLSGECQRALITCLLTVTGTVLGLGLGVTAYGITGDRDRAILVLGVLGLVAVGVWLGISASQP